MEIISIYFAVLSIVSFSIYYFLNSKYRILFLVLVSCGFIACFNFNLLLYVLIFAIINYQVGLKIPVVRYKKALFRAGIMFNLLQIIILKYGGFTINPILQLFNIQFDVTIFSEILIPIGISYFTLQGIGYIINIQFGWENPEKRLLHFLLYILFYPKFISGPIERSNHFLPQIKTQKSFNVENVTLGLKIALWGFFKKVIIANHLATTVTDTFRDLSNVGGVYVFLLILILPLYLYFDFSGYTDIAIGLAKTYGIDLIPNFNHPFLSENVTAFWKRFHISLSSWFNDYVFKQASFRFRKLKSHATLLAVFLTWILFGIWHGAGFNFMVLGLLQALAIYYEFLTKKKRTVLFSKLPNFIRIWTGRVITYCFYGISLVFFFSPDLSTAFKFFSRIKDLSDNFKGSYISEPLLFGLFFALLFMIYETVQNDSITFYARLQNYWTNHRFFRVIVYFLATTLLVSQLSGNKSFIYEMF
jgi:alginate O-acetyltransferase complex protein AlgI